ncbi:hypothetical protein EEDFHM_04078 [Methylorubrum populi]
MKWRAIILTLFASSAAHAQTAECEKIKSGLVPFVITQREWVDFTAYDPKNELKLGVTNEVITYNFKRTGDIVRRRHEKRQNGKSLVEESKFQNGFELGGDNDESKAFDRLIRQYSYENRSNFSFAWQDKKNYIDRKYEYNFVKNERIRTSPCEFDTIVFERLIHNLCNDDEVYCKKPKRAILHYSPELKIVLKEDNDNVGFFRKKIDSTAITMGKQSDWK